MRKVLLKIKNFVFKVIYLLLLVYLMIFIPSLWGYKPLVVVSGSMEPTLSVGGLLYYHKIDMNEFDTADILVYESGDHIISHRIVEITDTGFVTKGDANNTTDANEISKTQVLGLGTNWCIPYLGYYADFIYSHKYILYIATAVIVLDLLNDFYTTYKRKMGDLLEEETQDSVEE